MTFFLLDAIYLLLALLLPVLELFYHGFRLLQTWSSQYWGMNVDAINYGVGRNEQAERKRQLQGTEVNEGRAAKRARSSKFRVSGWKADGSERLVPIAPDNVSWEAWDAISSEQAGRKRQGTKVNEGRAAKRARFGDR